MKFRKFLKTVPMKLYVLLAAIIVFTFFSNDFGLVDIQKTAVILAAGIDRTEEGFSVTAQIAVPKGTDRTTGGTSSVEIEADGETVSACIANIYAKTGWVPKFVFCDLIVIGEEAAKEDVFSYLNYFIRNKYMNDSCMLAVCEGKAQELISSTSAIDDASSLAIGKLFSDAAVGSGRVMPMSLKEFSIGYYGASESSYLPFVRAREQKGAQSSGSGSSGGSSGGSGGSGGQSGAAESEKVYTADETALFLQGKMVALLRQELTFALSLLHGQVTSGNFNAKEEGTDSTLTILKDEGGVSLSMKGAPKATLSLSLTARLCCKSITSDAEEIANETAPKELLESAEEILQAQLADLWEKAKESGCDLFGLKKSLYRSSLKKFAEWKESLLTTVSPVFKVKVQSKR